MAALMKSHGLARLAFETLLFLLLASEQGVAKDTVSLGIDVQCLSVLNQSAGGLRPFYSQDLSVNALMKNCNLWPACAQEPSPDKWGIALTIVHEPAVGITVSTHFRDPGDASNSSTQSPAVTTHPQLSVQADLFNLSFQKGEQPVVELKLTTAPLVDLYGPLNGHDLQFQWPLQPAIEWHLDKDIVSAVGQVSIPLFTVGGRNLPPSFAIGILWHAFPSR
jgi:hypothetical protein